MPLQSIPEMMARAQAEKYAVGYFESWNLESLQGVLDAAEMSRAPVILGFNGDFLCRSTRRAQERLALYAALGVGAAEAADVPCGLIFNECPDDDWVRAAAKAGFNLVMPSDPNASSEEYTARVADICRTAHSLDVAVEAEVGELPCGASGEVKPGGVKTDPRAAAAFVEETNVDLLAVSVGNIHIMVKGEQPLDLDHLAAVREQVATPFVLHGGSGIEAESLQAAIALGCTKVNYGTYLKQRYLTAVRQSFAERPYANPHDLLGIGGDEDVMTDGRFAVRDAVLERIQLLGCCGRA